ncbi:MAG: DNA adenine methylase [Chloroflexota bacterium]
MIPRPFVKWAGGKGQLMAQLEPFWPTGFEGYIEPFVGGGAVFFHLYRHERLQGPVILNDLSAELINCYRVIRDDLDALLGELYRHAPHALDADYFYALRAWDRQADFLQRSDVERAARTTFLNRTCYNGLYRVNRRGHFNVPFGRYKKPRLVDEHNLRAVSRALQGVKLRQEDFGRCQEWARRGDLVYLDPPYDPLSATSSFTSYTLATFGEKEQRRLATLYRQLDAAGCWLMLSNSETPLIRELYRDYRIEVLQARRAINAQADGRTAIPELLILNYW